MENDKETAQTLVEVAEGLSDQHWAIDPARYLLQKGKIFVLETCKKKVLRKFHNSRMAVYPGSTKIYRDLLTQNKWPRMKRDMEKHVSKRLIGQ